VNPRAVLDAVVRRKLQKLTKIENGNRLKVRGFWEEKGD
jgi:hypothetical protein